MKIDLLFIILLCLASLDGCIRHDPESPKSAADSQYQLTCTEDLAPGGVSRTVRCSNKEVICYIISGPAMSCFPIVPNIGDVK